MQQQQQQQYQQIPIHQQSIQMQQSQMQAVQNSNSIYQPLDSGDITPHASMEHLPPPPAYLIGLTQEQRNYLNSDDAALKRMSN